HVHDFSVLGRIDETHAMPPLQLDLYFRRSKGGIRDRFDLPLTSTLMSIVAIDRQPTPSNLFSKIVEALERLAFRRGDQRDGLGELAQVSQCEGEGVSVGEDRRSVLRLASQLQ